MTEVTVNSIPALKEALKSSDITINLKKGEYHIHKPLKIKGRNITLKGEDGTMILASKRLEIDSDDKIFTINTKDHALPCRKFSTGPYVDYWDDYDIPKPMLENAGQNNFLFYENKELPLSIYPKDGYMRIKKTHGNNTIKFLKEDCGCMEGIFEPDDKAPSSWQDLDNIILSGYWNKDWAIQRHSIEKIENGVIHVNKPYHFLGYRDGKSYNDETGGGKFFAVNVKEEMKNKGEWCIDFKENSISLIPLKNQSYVDIAVCENIFIIENSENVTIENIELSQCIETAVTADNCKGLSIINCFIHNVGAWGVKAHNCTESTVSLCRITHTGGGGISIHGGDRNTLSSSDNKVTNNEIYETAIWHRVYMAAIEINGVGCIVSENYIHDLPHFAIEHGGNNHIIERNQIKNCCMESNDAGCIYGGRDWTSRGLVIRYNHISDCTGGDGLGCVGIYFDDGYSGAEVYGNILINVHNIGIELGGGRDFYIHNNIFMNCKMAILYDNRIQTWGESFYIKLMRHLDESNYRSEIWKKSYPQLYTIKEKNPRAPENNRIENNTVIGGDGFTINCEETLSISKFLNNTYIPQNIPDEIDKYHTTWIHIK